jgi:hypothetical protein
VQPSARHPPFDRSTTDAGAVQLGGGNQTQLAFRDPSHHQATSQTTMYKARNHLQPDKLGDISIREMLMSPGRRSAG